MALLKMAQQKMFTLHWSQASLLIHSIDALTASGLPRAHVLDPLEELR